VVGICGHGARDIEPGEALEVGVRSRGILWRVESWTRKLGWGWEIRRACEM